MREGLCHHKTSPQYSWSSALDAVTRSRWWPYPKRIWSRRHAGALVIAELFLHHYLGTMPFARFSRGNLFVPHLAP